MVTDKMTKLINHTPRYDRTIWLASYVRFAIMDKEKKCNNTCTCRYETLRVFQHGL